VVSELGSKRNSILTVSFILRKREKNLLIKYLDWHGHVCTEKTSRHMQTFASENLVIGFDTGPQSMRLIYSLSVVTTMGIHPLLDVLSLSDLIAL